MPPHPTSCHNCLHRIMVIKKVPNQKKRAIAEQFCCGNTLRLLKKLEKLIQISVQVKPIRRWEVFDKSKNGQNKRPRLSAKERYDTQGNPCGFGTDSCKGLLYQYNCEGCGVQAVPGQHRRWPSVRSSKNIDALMNKLMSFTVWIWMIDVLLSSW